jgi:hypothetical protein
LRDQDSKSNIFATQIKDDTGKVKGLTLNYPAGDNTCSKDPSRKYSLKVEIHCVPEKPLEFIGINDDPCDIVLRYNSKNGCASFSYDKLMMFLNNYY